MYIAFEPAEDRLHAINVTLVAALAD